MGQVISMAQAAPNAALEQINRLTGLEFDCWPESLLCKAGDTDEPEDVEEIDDADYGLPRGRIFAL